MFLTLQNDNKDDMYAFSTNLQYNVDPHILNFPHIS